MKRKLGAKVYHPGLSLSLRKCTTWVSLIKPAKMYHPGLSH